MMSEINRYVLETGVSLALWFAVYWMLLRRDTFFQWNRFFLLAALAVSFLLPTLDLSRPVHRWMPFLFPPAEPVRGLPAAPAAVRGASLEEWLLWIYAAGALLLLVRFAGRVIAMLALIRRTRVERRDGFRLMVSEDVSTPFSFFRFVFLGPGHLADKQSDRLVAHELVHVRRLHSLDLLLVELAIVFQWFNPAAWAYRKALKETHEFLADKEKALQKAKAKQDGDGEKVVLSKEELKQKHSEIEAKLADRSLSDKDRQLLLEKKKSIETALKADGKYVQADGDGHAPPPPMTAKDLLKLRDDIDAKLAGGSLPEKDREMLLKKKQKVETELQKLKDMEKKKKTP